jgi:hypothetical protein
MCIKPVGAPEAARGLRTRVVCGGGPGHRAPFFSPPRGRERGARGLYISLEPLDVIEPSECGQRESVSQI